MKKIELAELGIIHLNGIDFQEQKGITCDNQGNPLKYSIEGRGTSSYRNANGEVIPRKEVCKKLNIDGEEIIVNRLTPTTKIEKDVIEIIEDKDNSKMKLACERKIYAIHTDSKKIKDLLDEGKAISFPLVVGSGFKVWKGILNKHTTKSGKEVMSLFAVRGNIDEVFEIYHNEPLSIELDVVPKENAKNVKKMFSAIGC